MADYIPVSIDDLGKDYGTIRDRLMDELCKQQKYVDIRDCVRIGRMASSVDDIQFL